MLTSHESSAETITDFSGEADQSSRGKVITVLPVLGRIKTVSKPKPLELWTCL